MELLQNPAGNYRFASGIAPYSSGVVAAPGYEVVRATLQKPVPYRLGFDLMDAHLKSIGRPRQALCAIELRSPAPFSFAGFAEFNQGYQLILGAWDLLVDGHNPVARTHVAPETGAPLEPSLYAFSYTVVREEDAGVPTFVVAGAGDLRAGPMSGDSVVRAGETSVAALLEKSAHVLGSMQARLEALEATWSDVTVVDIYTVYPALPLLTGAIHAAIGPAAIHGVHWYYSRPPIADLAFEMDIRGVRRELRLA